MHSTCQRGQVAINFSRNPFSFALPTSHTPQGRKTSPNPMLPHATAPTNPPTPHPEPPHPPLFVRAFPLPHYQKPPYASAAVGSASACASKGGV